MQTLINFGLEPFYELTVCSFIHILFRWVMVWWRWTSTQTLNGHTGMVWEDFTRRTKATCKARWARTSPKAHLVLMCQLHFSLDWQPWWSRQAKQEVLRPQGLDQGSRGIDDQAGPRKLQVPQRCQCLRRWLAKGFLNVSNADYPSISQDKLGIWSWTIKPKIELKFDPVLCIWARNLWVQEHI